MFTPTLNFPSVPFEVKEEDDVGYILFDNFEECKDYCDRMNDSLKSTI